MKTLLKSLIPTALTVCALLAGTVQVKSDISVGVDPAKTWLGYMNVYDLGGAYLWGSPWGLGDLPAVFSSTSLTLSPNVSTYNPADPYWVNPDGSGNKRMEANVYVEDTSLGGNILSFSGYTLSYSLAPGYSAQAFIKEFGPGYSWIGWDFQPLADGSSFNVTRAIGAGNIAQYGLMLVGPNANPATAPNLGSASVALVPEPGSAALLGFGLLWSLGSWRRRQ